MNLETISPPGPSVEALDSVSDDNELAVSTGNRDQALIKLLGVDYEYAHQSGLLNDFYYDAKTGQDGVMHVLGGDYLTAEDGSIIPRGFHHEPSGRTTWGSDEKGNPLTFADESSLPQNREKRDFRQDPYNPYKAHVVVGGHHKKTVDIDPKTGARRIVDTKNGMFPKKYDALAVLQTIKMARDNRNTENDTLDLDKEVIIAEGEVPMLDGESTMRIKMILDAPSKKIKSAFPVVSRGQRMHLSREETKQHLGL